MGGESPTLDGITEVKGLSATLSTSSIKTSGTSVLTVTAGTNTAGRHLLDHSHREQRQHDSHGDRSTNRLIGRIPTGVNYCRSCTLASRWDSARCEMGVSASMWMRPGKTMVLSYETNVS